MRDFIDEHLDWLAAIGRSENTIDDRRKLLRRLDRDLPYGLDQAIESELTAWLAGRRLSVQAKATYIGHILGFYKWACDPRRPEYLDMNPAAALQRPTVPGGVPRPCTDEEAATLLTRSMEPYRTAAFLAAFGGLRCYEIVQLRREDITSEVILIFKGKGNKPATLDTHPALWEHIHDRPRGLLVTNKGQAFTADNLSRYAAAHFRKGLKIDVTLHRLRHWLLTTMLEQGEDLRTIQEVARHSSLATTQRYTLVTSARRRKAMRAVQVPSL